MRKHSKLLFATASLATLLTSCSGFDFSLLNSMMENNSTVSKESLPEKEERNGFNCFAELVYEGKPLLQVTGNTNKVISKNTKMLFYLVRPSDKTRFYSTVSGNVDKRPGEEEIMPEDYIYPEIINNGATFKLTMDLSYIWDQEDCLIEICYIGNDSSFNYISSEILDYSLTKFVYQYGNAHMINTSSTSNGRVCLIGYHSFFGEPMRFEAEDTTLIAGNRYIKTNVPASGDKCLTQLNSDFQIIFSFDVNVSDTYDITFAHESDDLGDEPSFRLVFDDQEESEVFVHSHSNDFSWTVSKITKHLTKGHHTIHIMGTEYLRSGKFDYLEVGTAYTIYVER